MRCGRAADTHRPNGLPRTQTNRRRSLGGIIDRMQEGMPDEFSSEDIEARAEVIYQYVETQMQSAAVH